MKTKKELEKEIDKLNKKIDILIQIVNQARVIKKKFNESSIRLKEKDKELQNLNKNLEHEVEKKTKELKILNSELEQRVKEEVEKNREKEKMLFKQARMIQLGEMLGNIAHQWRQPLSAITASAGGMKLGKEMGTMSDEEFILFHDTIIKNSKHLSQTINDFSNFVKQEKRHEEIILQDKINETINIVSASLQNNNIKIITEISEYPIKIELIPDEFTQVIMNIINNAKDALEISHKDDKWIKISLSKKENNALVTIEDNGGGILNEIMPKIFNPYFTTKHQSQGTGLGLYMSYELVRNSLKGNLYAKNTQNGAMLFIEMPLYRD